MITTINSNGFAALGNRYFGGSNALPLDRIDRLKPPKKPDDQSVLFFGNLNGQKTQTVQNGIVSETADTTPDLSVNPYISAQNILKRMGDIADMVANDTTLTANDRAKYDVEFQQLKQSLRDNGFGSEPTAAATSDPANAQLKNVQLISDTSNVLTASAAASASTDTVTGHSKLLLQKGGEHKAELKLQSIEQDAEQATQRVFSAKESEIQDLKSKAESLNDPARQWISRYNARGVTQFQSSILNVLA